MDCVIPFEDLSPKIILITTDNASLNCEDTNGMWAPLKKERALLNYNDMILIILWCAVHRSSLGFDDLEKQVPEVHRLIRDCSDVVKRFKKEAQADTLTLDELIKHIGYAVTDLIALQQEPLIGGWEEKGVKLLTIDGDKRTFFGVESEPSRRSGDRTRTCPFFGLSPRFGSEFSL
ncbi:hypothetical protein BV898_15681 [Hypsibius exemplaris]|uniref:Uncharacterized protein n=1 Tax=Hypsibius exemplaris TaxID=2072580 RepID=A0A9X6NEH1_HYPEX|nr:hypothetical protein BV898_15681 [Hypsibius exemplaris]